MHGHSWALHMYTHVWTANTHHQTHTHTHIPSRLIPDIHISPLLHPKRTPHTCILQTYTLHVYTTAPAPHIRTSYLHTPTFIPYTYAPPHSHFTPPHIYHTYTYTPYAYAPTPTRPIPRTLHPRTLHLYPLTFTPIPTHPIPTHPHSHTPHLHIPTATPCAHTQNELGHCH